MEREGLISIGKKNCHQAEARRGAPFHKNTPVEPHTPVRVIDSCKFPLSLPVCTHSPSVLLCSFVCFRRSRPIQSNSVRLATRRLAWMRHGACHRGLGNARTGLPHSLPDHLTTGGSVCCKPERPWPRSEKFLDPSLDCYLTRSIRHPG